MRLIRHIALTLSVAGLFVAPAGAQAPFQRRSIVQHYPYPYPGAYSGDQSAGYRNPGHLGRYKEYYPPGDRFQTQAAVAPRQQAATFGRGGGAPSYAEQRAAQQIGIRRSSAMQNHIDNYARPYFGYGFGVGYFGGFY